MADTTRHDDAKLFTKPCTFSGGITETASASPAAGTRGTISGAFVLADIQAGSKAFTTLPAGSIVTGISIRMTTALTFSAGTTTGVNLKVGTSGDDDGFVGNTALGTTTGYKYPSAGGVLLGCQVAGGNGSFTLTFTPTGGTPVLSEVSAGAGMVYLLYTVPA